MNDEERELRDHEDAWSTFPDPDMDVEVYADGQLWTDSDGHCVFTGSDAVALAHDLEDNRGYEGRVTIEELGTYNLRDTEE
jgi:hypothetical protein